MENLLLRYAHEALASCPQATWTVQPVVDYTGQRLALESMQAQLEDQALRAQNSVYIMLIDWALNAKWPRTRNAPVYFTREVLLWISSQEWHLWPGDLPDKSPPWTVKHVSKFLDLTVRRWYSTAIQDWAHSLAEECFSVQEAEFQMWHPHE